MPVYEYQCEKCKKTFEFLQKINDKPIEKCEECQGRLNKCFQQHELSFIRTGFLFSTDNKRKYLK